MTTVVQQIMGTKHSRSNIVSHLAQVHMRAVQPAFVRPVTAHAYAACMHSGEFHCRVEPGLKVHLTLRGHSWTQLYRDGQKGVQNDFL